MANRFYDQGDPFYRGPARGVDTSRISPWQPNGMPTSAAQVGRIQGSGFGKKLGAPNYMDERGGPEVGPANLKRYGPMFTGSQYGMGRMDRYGIGGMMQGGAPAAMGGLTPPRFSEMFQSGSAPYAPEQFAGRGMGGQGLGTMEKVALGVGAVGAVSDMYGAWKDRKREDEERERERDRMAKWGDILGGAMSRPYGG